jgi:geranyl-CoA carboxylase beta subunit
MGLDKMLRVQELALENKLPLCSWSRAPAPTCMRYGRGLRARRASVPQPGALSAAGLPVVTVVHGSSTAGGAYMPGCRTT